MVQLPINESGVMKAKLTVWISEAVKMMNATKRDKVQHCWAKTGLSDAWDETKYHELYEEAIQKRETLFPNSQDMSGSSNEIDDLEVADDLGERIELEVDKETGLVRTLAMEEDEELEEQLLSHVVQCAASLGIMNQEESDSGTLRLNMC